MIQYIHSSGVIYGVIPTIGIFFILWKNRGNPWEFTNLLCSLMLIGISAYTLVLFTQMFEIIGNMHDQKKIADGVFQELKISSAIWLAIIPVVTGGVGINVLSDYLSAKKI